MKNDLLVYCLKDVADWDVKINATVVIPRLQRGLVWDAIKTEVLWDSLFRGIPIGGFVVCSQRGLQNQTKKEDTYNSDGLFLLDGQQRANSIAMGFRRFPPPHGYETKPILWLDLSPNKPVSGTRREFWFKVTTQAHPWGYKSTKDENETAATRLDAWEQRDAASQVCPPDALKRPKPFELWPTAANLPIPVYLLTSAFKEKKDATVKEFWREVVNAVDGQSNWAKRFLSKLKEVPHSLERIYEGLQTLFDTKICAVKAPEALVIGGEQGQEPDSANIAVLFERLNVQGEKPTQEELAYSVIKSFWPDLKEIDEIAEGRMIPYRMASMAMQVYLTRTGNKWNNRSITVPEIRKLAKDPERRIDVDRFINHELKPLCERVDEWLGFTSDGKAAQEWSLLKVHRTSISRNSRAVYQLLLLIAGMEGSEGLPQVNMAALATILHWFSSNQDKIAERIYEACVSCDGRLNLQVIKNGLWKAIWNHELLVPCPYNKLAILFDSEPRENTSFIGQLQVSPWWLSIDRIWNGFDRKKMGTELLLFAQRKYIRQVFDDYDPSQRDMWEGHNCPWDYDHILPKTWIGNHGQCGNGVWMNACRDLLWSIGNSAAIPFTLNRAKNDDPPGENYCGETEADAMSVDLKAIGLYKRCWLDHDRIAALHFIQTTRKRFLVLYKKWYETLDVEKWFAKENPLLTLRSKLAENRTVHYMTADGVSALPDITDGYYIQELYFANGNRPGYPRPFLSHALPDTFYAGILKTGTADIDAQVKHDLTTLVSDRQFVKEAQHCFYIECETEDKALVEFYSIEKKLNTWIETVGLRIPSVPD